MDEQPKLSLWALIVDFFDVYFWKIIPFLGIVIAFALGIFLTVPVLVLYLNTVKDFWFG